MLLCATCAIELVSFPPIALHIKAFIIGQVLFGTTFRIIDKNISDDPTKILELKNALQEGMVLQESYLVGAYVS